jgi:tripartite-type tricarboxylate transporter receptor subunit TctC
MLALAWSAATPAQPVYPAKPIRMVVPFPPGGTTDILARVAGQKITEATGQQVIVDNRPGAGGNIGTEIVARAPADGYTLLTDPGSTLTINPSLFSKLPFDTLKDLSPVTIIAAVPNLLVVHPSLPVKSVKELVALAKARRGQLNYASTGAGQSTHLSMELFKLMAGIDMTHIPYKGSSPALTDLLAGQVSLMFDNMPSCLPHVKANKLRALGVRHAPALARTAGAAYRRRVGAAGIRGQCLVRRARAGGHAARCRRPSERDHRQGAREP